MDEFEDKAEQDIRALELAYAQHGKKMPKHLKRDIKTYSKLKRKHFRKRLSPEEAHRAEVLKTQLEVAVQAARL